MGEKRMIEEKFIGLNGKLSVKLNLKEGWGSRT